MDAAPTPDLPQAPATPAVAGGRPRARARSHHPAREAASHRDDGPRAAGRHASGVARRARPHPAPPDLRTRDRRARGRAVARSAGGALLAGAADAEACPPTPRSASPRPSWSGGSRACSTGSRPRCSRSRWPHARSSRSCVVAGSREHRRPAGARDRPVPGPVPLATRQTSAASAFAAVAVTSPPPAIRWAT